MSDSDSDLLECLWVCVEVCLCLLVCVYRLQVRESGSHKVCVSVSVGVSVCL